MSAILTVSQKHQCIDLFKLIFHGLRITPMNVVVCFALTAWLGDIVKSNGTTTTILENVFMGTGLDWP